MDVESKEIISALAESNIDRAVSDEIIEKLERYENIQEELRSVFEEWISGRRKLERYENRAFFAVINTCKDDMKEEFEASPKMQLEIEQFADDQMRAIAEKIGAVLTDAYWAALHIAVEEELNAR